MKKSAEDNWESQLGISIDIHELKVIYVLKMSYISAMVLMPVQYLLIKYDPMIPLSVEGILTTL